MQKMTELQIKEFLGIREATFDLSTRAVLITAGNNQGKSTVCDAFAMLFTGKVPGRGYHKKNQATRTINRAVRDQSKAAFQIRLQTEGGMVYERRNGKGSESPLDESLALIAANPQSILYMPPADRQKAFKVLFASAGCDMLSEIMSVLEKADMEQFILDRVTTDLDAFQAWAVETRRQAKRELAEANDKLSQFEAKSIVKVGSKTYDLKKTDVNKVQATIETCRKERDDLIASRFDVGKLPELQAEKKAADAFIAEADKQATRLADKLAVLQRDHVAATKSHDDCNSVVSDLKATVKLFETQIKTANELGDTCTVCSQKIDATLKKSMVDGLCQQMDLEVAKLASAEEKQTKAALAWSKASTDIKNCRDETDQLARDIEANKNWVAECEMAINRLQSAPDVDSKIKAFDDRLAIGNELLTHAREFAELSRKAENLNDCINLAETTIEQTDKLDAMLKPEGELRQLETKEFESFAFDQLASDWGMDDLKIEADGTITYDGDPIEAASESEKYRASVLLAELLCRSLETNFIILDRVDLLERKHRRALLNRVVEWRPHFANVIMLMTSDGGEKTPDVDWLRYYRLEDGRIVDTL